MLDESKILLPSSQQNETKPEQSFFRLNLTDCFFLTTFAAVFVWCASIVGIQSPALWVGLVIATLLGWLISNRLAKQRMGSVLWISGICFFICGLGMSLIPVAVSCLLYGCVAMFCGMKIASLRAWQRTSLVITAIGFIAWLAFPNPRLIAIYELREAYPVESLKQRLLYEPEIRPEESAYIKLSAAVAQTLDQTDVLYKYHFFDRSDTLKRAHDKRLEQFLRANGFGAMRMITPSKSRVEKPPLASLSFDAGIPVVSDDNEYQSWQYNNERFIEGFESDTDKFHRAGIFDFLDPESFGWVQEKQNVSGFISHAFHGIDDEVVHDDVKWRLKELQLVSLLKFDEPKVYVLEHLPRMDHLNGSEIETRPLDSFESDSLSSLYATNDLVVEPNDEQLRMLGSIRASHVCLECHTATRGELLGAFTYRFELVDKRDSPMK